jgi:hypothetical protein
MNEKTLAMILALVVYGFALIGLRLGVCYFALQTVQVLDEIYR